VAASNLAKQIADLRKLVDQHVARKQLRPRLRIIYREGTPDTEIEQLQVEALAAALRRSLARCYRRRLLNEVLANRTSGVGLRLGLGS
jgi:hypothetical protein